MSSPASTYVLGISAYHGDASAALIRDGVLLAAVEEERFRRIKHWAGFPTLAIQSVLAQAGITGRDVTHVAVGRDRSAHLWRKAWFTATHRPSPTLLKDRLRNRQRLGNIREPLAVALSLAESELPRIESVEHHTAHLASAFAVSPFADAACCAIDGFGDFVSTSFGQGSGATIEVLDRVYFPHSLGMFYTAVTQFLGFPSYGDEFKVMGLAPYGSPAYVGELRQLVRLIDRGRFELDLQYFRHWSDGVAMEWDEGYPTLGPVWTSALEHLLGPARRAGEPLTSRHEDLAHSLQAVYEECAFHVLNGLWDRTHNPRLCLAGGCAMNSVANGKVRTHTPFRELFIQPAAGDNGTALGAAYQVWQQSAGARSAFTMSNGYWGPAHTNADVEAAVDERIGDTGGMTQVRHASPEAAARVAAQLIADGKVVGWYQGRMEWGARALGNRSIVADPRRSDIRETINLKIKFREKFRPFAPSIAEEALDEYFVGAVPDPFMVQVYPVRDDKRAVIPAVTHVDGSGRLQTVSATTNPLYYRLIKEFEAITGVPVLLNTSFNENEPIVDTPQQALDCFLRTNMDAIVLGALVIQRVGPRTSGPIGLA